jgi:hypothetical protein
LEEDDLFPVEVPGVIPTDTPEVLYLEPPADLTLLDWAVPELELPLIGLAKKFYFCT